MYRIVPSTHESIDESGLDHLVVQELDGYIHGVPVACTTSCIQYLLSHLLLYSCGPLSISAFSVSSAMHKYQAAAATVIMSSSSSAIVVVYSHLHLIFIGTDTRAPIGT